MTRQEVKEVIQEQLQDTEPEVVASAFMEMYLDGKITIDDLKFAVDECGFELDEEFANASFEDQKKMTTPPENEENKEEEAKEENTKEEEAPEEERASKSEGYDGEKVYDKQGQPTQVNQSTGSEDNNEKEKAEKLFNVSF